MDAREWLGLEPTHNPRRWYLPVVPGISTGGGFLFGGCGLGAAISALEGATGRPVVWATAQYLSFARPGSIMDIDVTVAVDGRQTTQARAVGHVGGTEILTVNAALGSRDFPEDGPVGRVPRRAAARRLPARASRAGTSATRSCRRLDQRWADPRRRQRPVLGLDPHARPARRCRPPALAVLGDYVPFGIGADARATRSPANSLDNTLRVAERRAHRVGAASTSASTSSPTASATASVLPVGRGRHAPGHRQPVRHRPPLAGRGLPAGDGRIRPTTSAVASDG